jgi:hypothetical protein
VSIARLSLYENDKSAFQVVNHTHSKKLVEKRKKERTSWRKDELDGKLERKKKTRTRKISLMDHARL